MSAMKLQFTDASEDHFTLHAFSIHPRVLECRQQEEY